MRHNAHAIAKHDVIDIKNKILSASHTLPKSAVAWYNRHEFCISHVGATCFDVRKYHRPKCWSRCNNVDYNATKLHDGSPSRESMKDIVARNSGIDAFQFIARTLYSWLEKV